MTITDNTSTTDNTPISRQRRLDERTVVSLAAHHFFSSETQTPKKWEQRSVRKRIIRFARAAFSSDGWILRIHRSDTRSHEPAVARAAQMRRRADPNP